VLLSRARSLCVRVLRLLCHGAALEERLLWLLREKVWDVLAPSRTAKAVIAVVLLFCRAALLCNRMHNDCQELVGRSEVILMQV
jgi:hypothetical protein